MALDKARGTGKEASTLSRREETFGVLVLLASSPYWYESLYIFRILYFHEFIWKPILLMVASYLLWICNCIIEKQKKYVNSGLSSLSTYVRNRQGLCLFWLVGEVYNLGGGVYLCSTPFRKRVARISGSILIPEKLEIWVWTGLSSQKRNWNRTITTILTALWLLTQEELGPFPDFRPRIFS